MNGRVARTRQALAVLLLCAAIAAPAETPDKHAVRGRRVVFDGLGRAG